MIGPRRMNLVVKRWLFLAAIFFGIPTERALDWMVGLGVRHYCED